MDPLLKVQVLLNDQRILHEMFPHGAETECFSRDTTVLSVLQHFCNKYEKWRIYFDHEKAVMIHVDSNFKYLNNKVTDHTEQIGNISKTCSSIEFILEEMGEAALNNAVKNFLGDFVRTVDVFVVYVNYRSVRMRKRLWVYDKETIETIRQRICQFIPQSIFDNNIVRVVLQYSIENNTFLRTIMNYRLPFQHYLPSNEVDNLKLYVDWGSEEILRYDRKFYDVTKSQMYDIIYKHLYGTKLLFCLPSTWITFLCKLDSSTTTFDEFKRKCCYSLLAIDKFEPNTIQDITHSDAEILNDSESFICHIENDYVFLSLNIIISQYLQHIKNEAKPFGTGLLNAVTQINFPNNLIYVAQDLEETEEQIIDVDNDLSYKNGFNNFVVFSSFAVITFLCLIYGYFSEFDCIGFWFLLAVLISIIAAFVITKYKISTSQAYRNPPSSTASEERKER